MTGPADIAADGAACDRMFVGLIWGHADRAFEAPGRIGSDAAADAPKRAAEAAVDRLAALYDDALADLRAALAAYAAAWAHRATAGAGDDLSVEPRDLQALAGAMFHDRAPDAPSDHEEDAAIAAVAADLGLDAGAIGRLSTATYPFLALKPRYRGGAAIFDPSMDVRLSTYFGADVSQPALMRRRLVRGLTQLLNAPRGGELRRDEDEPLRVFTGRSRTHIPLRYGVPETEIVSVLTAALTDAGLEGARRATALRRARSDLRHVFPAPDLVDIDDRLVDGSYRIAGPSVAPYRLLPTAVDTEISERDAAFLRAWRVRDETTPRHEKDIAAPAAREVVKPLTPFRAKRVDYTLSRIEHYTGLPGRMVQDYVFFTNYPFYMKAFVSETFERYVRHGCGRLILPHVDAGAEGLEIAALPPDAVRSADGGVDADRATQFSARQMPAVHFIPNDGSDAPGVTIVNIGVGPSNAKTMCDLIAALAPAAWLMLGHCGGLRVTQEIGQFVLAQAYVRDDHVFDAGLPLYAPIPQVTEVQECLMRGIEDVLLAEDAESERRFADYALHRRRMMWILRRFGVEIPDPTRLRFERERVAERRELAQSEALRDAGLILDPTADPSAPAAADAERIAAQHQAWRDELRARVRTGTVLTTDDRNWELRPQEEMLERFERSRAVAVDMESATIAAAGVRYRIPYGALLCVSDKPLMGEPKMRGQADEFYETATRNHVKIGLTAAEHLSHRADDLARSRKLTGLDDPPIL